MYASFFGLKHEPFSIAPDPRYLFMSDRHREALAHLLYGVNGGGGFVVLSGEIGAGKTTVCRCFLEQIPQYCNVAYIFNPKLSAHEMLLSVCEEFGIPRPQPTLFAPTVKDYLDPLNAFLLASHAAGRNNVLIIDEAQLLSARVLEQLRMLTNLETNDRKLLQIILIGQPELRDLLARPELEQLAQRVIARYHLGALTEAETEHYVRHRLAVAGLNTASPFDHKAMQRIHSLARGVPRRINLLCDRSLLGAFSLGKAQVDRAIVDRAAIEVFGHVKTPPRSKRRRRAAWGLVGLASAAVMGAAIGAGLLLIASKLRARSATHVAAAPPNAAATASMASSAFPVSSASLASSPAPAPSVPSARSALAAGTPIAASPPRAASASGVVAAMGAAASASGAARAGSAAAPENTTDLRTQWKSLPRNENDAWRQLATHWKLVIDESVDPCAAAQRSELQCFRSPGTTLALIRQLDRPGILTLHEANDRPAYVLLTGLTNQSAILRVGKVSQTVPLVTLATLWRGDFATLWRAPPAYSGKVVDGSPGPVTSWMTTQLARLHGSTAPAGASGPAAGGSWKSRISSFQVSQGLKPDGVVGPTTYMQLNRAIGIDEPRLRTDAGH